MHYLKRNIDGSKAIYKTQLEIKKNKSSLSFTFLLEHCSFNSYSNRYNDKLYLGDVIELFITRKQKNHYYEIEVAPNGTLFFADIYNDDKNLSITYLENNGINVNTSNLGDVFCIEVLLSISFFKDLDENTLFNAFRIETDNEKSEKHLFSLSPTYCNNFHKVKYFINLNKNIDKTIQ